MITPGSEKVRIDFDQQVPMRDGVMLSADVYHPVETAGAEKTYPAVLMGTPYMTARRNFNP